MKNSLAVVCVLAVFMVVGPLLGSQTKGISSERIYEHIAVLAHDSLEGRQVGEAGEWKAAQYIAAQFEKLGLSAKGDEGTFFQSFDFIKQIDFGPENRLSLNGHDLELGSEFQPMKQSANRTFDFGEIVDVGYGITVDEKDGKYDDYEGKDVAGKGVLIRRFSPSADDNPHVDFGNYESLTDKIRTAIANEAGGVFFITPEDQDDTLMSIGAVHIRPKEIPIILVRRAALEKLELDLSLPVLLSAAGETELVRTRDTGYNVIGHLTGETDTVIMMGAHYDHLGWGGPSSLYTGKEKMIHNGADDNASGVACMLETARYFASTEGRPHHSMLFIAFTGEEAGLLGSSHFAKNMTVDSSKVRMMLNVDMIGRLADQDTGLAVMGTGTAVEFKSFFDSLDTGDLTLATKESGTGPSDHTIFYNRKIPSLHFFTGAHSDYHKPSDDIETIDIEGIVRVTSLITDVVSHFDQLEGELTFQKTKDPDAGKRRARFSVTLGVMPDYVAEVEGLKIDGVIPERPAERAGILEGDIVVKMGAIVIGDIYDYMNALGKFRKGDTCIVIVERGSETVELQVIFE